MRGWTRYTPPDPTTDSVSVASKVDVGELTFDQFKQTRQFLLDRIWKP
jgi:hypothetical protein